MMAGQRGCLVVSLSADLAGAVGAAATEAGWAVAGIGPWPAPAARLGDDAALSFERAAATVDAAAAEHRLGVAIVCSRPWAGADNLDRQTQTGADDPDPRTQTGGDDPDPRTWTAAVLDHLRVHAAWSHAAYRAGLTLVNVVDSSGPGAVVAGGIAQLSRSLQAARPAEVWRCHLLDVVDGAAAWPLAGLLAAWLGDASAAIGLAGEELAVGDDWIGLRGRPEPAFTVTLGDGDTGAWLDHVLRAATGV